MRTKNDHVGLSQMASILLHIIPPGTVTSDVTDQNSKLGFLGLELIRVIVGGKFSLGLTYR